jgi:circadian clock protein KaiC
MRIHSRCITGVEGLDDILCGGLPANRIYLLKGDPGVGKTTLALQFLLEGANRGEAGLYFTLSETKEELEITAESHGWDLKKINVFELSAIEENLKREAENTFFNPSDVELNRTTKTLLDEVDRIKPTRVVFDSLSEMRMLAETPLRYRRQILRLKQYFAGRKCTVLFLDDNSSGAGDLQVESIAHGVLQLRRSLPEYGIMRRQLQVDKIRGVRFREGYHDYNIETGGLKIFPRLVAAEHHVEFKHESFSSGIRGLDLLLGGGLDRGTSNMFAGPPGSGKSTIALQFAVVAAQHNENVLFFIFDETTGTLIHRAKALGLNLKPHIENGTIKIEQVDPAEISPGELAHRIRVAVDKNNVRMVVIDSINGYMNAMPAERYLNLQLHELLSYLNQQGVISIMILAQQGIIGPMESSIDLTYLADTVVTLRYFEALGAVKQALAVIKKRSGGHERTIREMIISEKGIEVGVPLANLQGVLTGTPSFLRAEQ